MWNLNNFFFILPNVHNIYSVEHGEKEDVYQLGLILLEIIVGKPTESRSELDTLKLQVCILLTLFSTMSDFFY